MNYLIFFNPLKQLAFKRIGIWVILCCLLLIGGIKNELWGKTPVRIGILPFQVFSGEKVDYLKEVVHNNLAQQLKANEEFILIAQDELAPLVEGKEPTESFSLSALNRIAARSGAQFLIYGSLTKIEDNISIDTRVFTTLGTSPLYKDFVEGSDLELLIKNLSTKISNHISQVVLASPPPLLTAEQIKKPAPSPTSPAAVEPAPEPAPAPIIEERFPSEAKAPAPQKEDNNKITPAEETPSPPEETTSEKTESSFSTAKKTSDTKTPFPKPKALTSDQPVSITSDRMVADNRNRTVNFLGNVVAKRADMIIFSDQISAVYTEDGKIEKIISRGNVKINQADRTATCQEATFFQLRQQIVMTGKPKVWQGKNIVTGDRIIIYIKEDRVEVESDKQISGKPGRVNAIIYPEGKEIKK